MEIENSVETESETNTGVEEGSSPETPSEEGSGDSAAKAAAAKTTEDNVPFHEHPRFKELVEQKNQAQAQQKSLEEKYAAMEARIQRQMLESQPKAKTEEDALIAKLKGIDPEFAARIEQHSKSLQEVEMLKQRLQQFESNQIRTQAVSQVNTLHDTNKVSPEMRTFINSQLDLMAMQGQIKDLSELPKAYNQVYTQYKTFVDNIERTTRESYVKAKKADTSTPTSQPKGKPVSHAAKKPTFSSDPEVAKAQIVSRYLKQAKAEADAV